MRLDKAQEGQALLIVILTMVVALTVGLSVASRSITTVRISTAEEQSQRAFSAAEAGIEEALKSGANVALTGPLANNAQYSATVTTSGNSKEFIIPPPGGRKDEAVQIWLSAYPNYTDRYTGKITVFWEKESTGCNAAAVEIIVFSGAQVTSPSLNRYPIDPCTTRGNNFYSASLAAGETGKMKDFKYKYEIPVLISNGLIMRIIPLYKSTSVGVKGDNNLPTQGTEIEAIGKVVSGGEEITRKIRVVQSYPSLPAIFDYAIFSGTSL